MFSILEIVLFLMFELTESTTNIYTADITRIWEIITVTMSLRLLFFI